MTRKQLVTIAAGPARMEGVLALPVAPIGMVLFAHGSGSGRHSPRNHLVAARLRDAGIGTLVLDLLGADEERRDEHRFDIALLTERLALAASWLGTEALTAPLSLGLFGASTGAAAALRLAARDGSGIAAVVARGGRPDLAGAAALATVVAPTLLIVGGDDGVVVDLNRQALSLLRCDKQLLVIPGATHLFEEPGKLGDVAEAAADWFVRYLVPL
ncbi:MAG: dienelactone hydrolase family protein [Janthinobacterium lividum]